MHKIFIAQKSHCACHVLSLATIRSKYYFNFTLSRSRSGRELFDRPFKVCVQNVHHVLERKLEAVDATAWPLPDDQLAEMFPVFDQALLQLVNVMLLQLPLNLVVDWVKLRSGLLAGHRAGVMKSGVLWVNRCTCFACFVGTSVVLHECLTAVCNAILETEIFCRQHLNINNSCNK